MPTILIAGASRGLGLALVADFATRGWHVIGTIRDVTKPGELHTLAAARGGQVEIETLDITDGDEIAALAARLAGQRIDILFINAGITTGDPLALARDVAEAEFVRIMVTNALSPLRVVEALAPLVPIDGGLIGVMSSGQGSIANNAKGTREVYRASKAALNMLVQSFAVRPEEAGRALALIAPGWVRTDLGGPDAPFTIEDTVPKLAAILLDRRGKPGLAYLDRDGETVPW